MAELIVIDVETSPNLAYVWGLFDQRIGINQIVESQDILCFAAMRIGAMRVETKASRDGYDAMLQRLWTLMDEADYIISYNGISFDEKIIKAAFVKAGMPPPSPYRSIDLMRVVKKNFRLPSNKLAYVCAALGLDHKTDPGGFSTWTDILQGTDEQRAKAWRRLVKYCANDVRITVQLFEALRPWIDGLNLPLYSDEEPTTPTCTRCGSSNIQSRGHAYATSFRYRRFRCSDCGGWMRDKKSEPTPNVELRNV